MKKLLFTALIAVSFMSSAFAYPVNFVSNDIINSFQGSFPKATNVQWDVNAHFAKATFVTDHLNTEAYYSLNGEFIGTSHAVTIDNLPTWAKRRFAKKYGSYIVKEAIQFDGVEETAYFISAENENQTVIIKAVDGVIGIFKKTSKN
jgi:hypothetical protein